MDKFNLIFDDVKDSHISLKLSVPDQSVASSVEMNGETLYAKSAPIAWACSDLDALSSTRFHLRQGIMALAQYAQAQ